MRIVICFRNFSYFLQFDFTETSSLFCWCRMLWDVGHKWSQQSRRFSGLNWKRNWIEAEEWVRKMKNSWNIRGREEWAMGKIAFYSDVHLPWDSLTILNSMSQFWTMRVLVKLWCNFFEETSSKTGNRHCISHTFSQLEMKRPRPFGLENGTNKLLECEKISGEAL